MTRYGSREYLEFARRHRGETQQMLQHVEREVAAHHQRHAVLQRDLEQARIELGEAMLPRLDQASLERAASLSGYTPLVQQDWMGRLRGESEALRQRIAQIEQDPRFAGRELLRHPRTGSLTRQMQELLEHKKPWDALLAAADHPRLSHLLAVEYGTDTYAVPFWRASYYADWEAGDAILEAVQQHAATRGGASPPDFAAVRVDVLRAYETLTTLQDELRRAEAEWKAGVELEAEHAERSARLRDLEVVYLRDARFRLVQHLLALRPEHLKDRLSAHPDLKLLLLKTSGLAAKAEYTDALVNAQLLPLQGSLRDDLGKADRDIQKMQRPKNRGATFTPEQMTKRFRSPRDRYGKRWDRYDHTYRTVYVFDDYRRGDLVTDLLWWDLMTDGRIDGDFIPSVSAFHQSQPDYTYDRKQHEDDGDLEAHAAAASLAEATAADDATHTSFDPS